MISYVNHDVLTRLVLVFPFSPLVHPQLEEEGMCGEQDWTGWHASAGKKKEKRMEHAAYSVIRIIVCHFQVSGVRVSLPSWSC